MNTLRHMKIFGISLLFCFLIACKDDISRMESTEPVLVSVSPKAAKEKSIVTILGRNFSFSKEENIVKFNGINTIVLEASAGELKVLVPEGGTNGVITVNVKGIELIGPEFTYELPGIEYVVRTLAGGGAGGFVDGTGVNAQFDTPEGVNMDFNGNIIVADRANNAIRRVTPEGMVTTIAGTGIKGLVNGPAATAQFNFPWKSAVDGQGNIYVAERDNDCIRKITPEGVVSTLAGSTRGYAEGKGTAAKFNQPIDVAVDGAGNLYVTDNNNHRIRKITPDGTVSTLAGSNKGYADGNGIAALFSNPSGIDVDATGNVYVADRNNHRIRKITPNGDVTTIAGTGGSGKVNGDAAVASFNQPYGIAIAPDGEVIIADLVNNLIRKIDVNGQVSTIAGTVSGFSDGAGGSARFNQPTDVAVSADKTIYVADLGNKKIRKITVL